MWVEVEKGADFATSILAPQPALCHPGGPSTSVSFTYPMSGQRVRWGSLEAHSRGQRNGESISKEKGLMQ